MQYPVGQSPLCPAASFPYQRSEAFYLLDLTQSEREYQVGDEIEFSVSYGSVLSTFTSKYIKIAGQHNQFPETILFQSFRLRSTSQRDESSSLALTKLNPL
jgi:hypothetical protein